MRIAQVKPLLDLTTEDFERMFRINVFGVQNCYSAAARQMISQGNGTAEAPCKMLAAASIVAFKPFALLSHYSASKWAVRGLTQAYAMEMAEHHITVNAYAPGIVGTAMWDLIDEELGKKRGNDLGQVIKKGETIKKYTDELIALGRVSVPEDVAKLVSFLAGPDSNYITGQTQVVDGAPSRCLYSGVGRQQQRPKPVHSVSLCQILAPTVLDLRKPPLTRPPPRSAMDQQATTLLTTLKRSSAASDAKLTQLNNLKSDIKHHRVPDNAQPIIFECLRVALTQQASSTLATAAFTTLGHLIKRLKIQDPDGTAISQHVPKLFVALQERLGDLRENHRNAASQAFADAWHFCPQDVENIIRDEVIPTGNVRAKDAAMHWVVRMNRDEALPFKSFVPLMVANLEDHDGAVRDSAKSALVDLFRHAPDRAKADLKKQLNLHGVRTGIASQILTQIDSDKASAPAPDMSHSTRSLPALDPHLAESINSEAARAPPPEEIPMDPIFVHSQRELEDTFSDMLPFFEGRESEENWGNRDKSVTKMRRLLKGNAPTDYHTLFMASMKQMQAGIIKVATSLRTTTSSNGCFMVQELARTLGPALDPMVEIYLQTFIKMCAATKNIAAQNGNQTVDTIYQYVSYNIRTMQHVWVACQDKNVQPRTFASGWLRTILSRQAGAKSHFESTGGLELAEKCVKHGLNDSQPKVKEAMRATYWALARVWPNRADLIMNTLDPKAKTALEKHPQNPNAPTTGASHASTLRASTVSRAGAASKSSVRDAIIAARKKAQAESRPNSAMATVSPTTVRSKSSNNLSARQPSAAPPASARVPSAASTSSSTSTSNKPNALMSGAARRPVRRPELPRPATADPYASRRLARPETPSIKSPITSPRQETATVVSNTSASKNRGERSSPALSPFRQSYLSPRSAANRSRPSSRDSKSEQPAAPKEDDFASFVPTSSYKGHLPTSPNSTRSHLPTSPQSTLRRPTLNGSASVDSVIPVIADDTFTMELPTVHRTQMPSFERRPSQLSNVDPIADIQPAAPQYTRRASDRNDSPITISQRASPRPVSPPKTASARASPVPTLAPAAQIEPSAPQSEEATFQIHEDPFMEGIEASEAQKVQQSQDARNVLSEVPVNEFSQVSIAEGSNKDEVPETEDSTPQETLRSRKLLMSGIERIRGRTLDAHGFRKVLELIKSSESGEIFGSVGEGRRFDDLCSVLLEYIVESSDAAANPNVRHSQELRRQATSVMRTVLNAQQSPYRKWIAAGRWYSRSLTGALDARQNVEGSGLLVKDLEALASDIVAKIHPDEGERAIIQWLENRVQEADYDTQEQELDGAVAAIQARHGDESMVRKNKAMALALRNLAALLASTTATASPLSKELGERAGRVAVVSLRSKDAEVRKSSVELATQLHMSWPSDASAPGDPKSEFWGMLEKNGLQESARNLIVYFIARRERSG
ncbi:hypothetical protein D6D15_06167 [Aureobasidium pullulans]|uniref:TOG domain-containing protein n=1 Tax=Aureobasidium pullulans TaxID=5580 RepID=A0A4S9B5X5_AURPU|nr:hypothetical protein D6D15_06167 [Aureobasidium pullulans]